MVALTWCRVAARESIPLEVWTAAANRRMVVDTTVGIGTTDARTWIPTLLINAGLI